MKIMVNDEHMLTLLFIIILSFFVITSHGSCNQIDHTSLLSFSINISTPFPLNWNTSTDCCIWEGIDCNNFGRVTRLWLPNRSLTGKFSPAITELAHLSQLNLSGNLISGPFPDGFFLSLIQLQTVDLSYNRLSGPLPVSDKLPVSIQTVDLSNNKFNGTVEFSFLQAAVNLMSFSISNNSFFGSIPSFICSISPLITSIDVSYNVFNGSIPQDIGNCSNLSSFRAGFNSLSGALPDGIYKMFNLQELFLPSNKLYGPINDTIVNLNNLTILALYANAFTGVVPLQIGKLLKLEQLLLHINKLNGTLPISLMNCTSLTILNLRVNAFVGDISSLDFSKLNKLEIIDLGNNFFNGNLPASLFTLMSLTAIRFAGNRFNGVIPPSIVALQSLSFLSISNNTLSDVTGAITVLKACKNLSTLILSKNFYNEWFPSNDSLVGSEEFQNIRILGFGGCRFSGEIPSWLTKLGKLQLLDLSQNFLTGVIPGWFGNLPNLFYLDLSTNLLVGNFPKELTGLQALTTNSSANQVDQNHLELPVFVQPDNVSSLQYNQVSSLPPAIYLFENNLSGEIPITIGQLKYMHVLDLSHNNFSGIIPNTMSDLTNLERLDLSNNQLSGEIPASLGQLHFLSWFSVAYNNLQGTIPAGVQFDTFPNTSFIGNPELCGRILQRPCLIKSENTSLSTTRKSPKKRIIIGLILGICLGIGFTVSVLAFWKFSKRKILPNVDASKHDMETEPFDSGLSMQIQGDTSVFLMFPNVNHTKDLTIMDVLKATNNFDQANIIGCGGFGLVYKATLENGTKVAIKKLSGDMGLMEREFKAEVEALSTAQHENLVALQGYSIHDGCRLLIYSYMENGSLDYWLHEKSDGPTQLDWPIRLKIVQGSSNGLAYMHLVCNPHIVHRDIKSSNILLNERFEARVADFGLARMIHPYKSHVTTELVGTLGYIPPEYNQSWIATLRGDIYSFGVVLLELLTGKRPVEMFKPKTSRELVVWVQQMKNDGKKDEIFDPILRGKGYEEEMNQVLDVACLCVNQNPFKRPNIQEVVDWLKDVGRHKREQEEEEESLST